MNHLRILILSILIASMAVVPVLAKQCGNDGIGRNGKNADHLARLTTVLDLTAEQTAEVGKIITERKNDAGLLHEKSQAARVEIREMLEKDVLNESRLQELVHEQSAIKTKMMIERHNSRNRINQILTPEQQQKHAELRQLRMEHRGRGEGPRCKEL